MKIAPSVQSKVPVPTREGLATLALTGFLFLLATNLMAGWLFFLVAFLLAVLLVGAVSARGAVRAVRLEAGATDPAVEGGEVTVPVVVEGRKTVRFVQVEVAVGEERAARFLPVVRRGIQREVLRFPSPARGAYPLGHLDIASAGLLGMFRVRRRIPVRGEVIVRPRYQVLAALPAALDGEGEAATLVRRQGSDLRGVREYQPGDAARHVHWRSSARHRRLMVKEFEAAGEHVMTVVVDAGRDQERSELDQAVRAAASIVRAALERGWKVTLLAGAGPVIVRGTWEAMWEALARLEGDGPPLDQALADLGPLPAGVVPVVVSARPQRTGPRPAILVGPRGSGAGGEYGPDGEVRWAAS